MSLRDEVKYGITYGRDASNLSTDSLLHVLQRDAYEVYRAHFDLPEFSVGVRGASWEEWEDIPYIDGGNVWREVDLKRYELKDHLGNVRMIVSDLRHAKLDNGVPTDFTALIKHYSNYYPFGMEKEAMVWDKGGYRYGYQGQEVDNEMLGTSNAISYKYRVEDARLGRFFSIDPLSAKYPWNSPYAFSENRVIDGVELEGLEFVRSEKFDVKTGVTTITFTANIKVIDHSGIYSESNSLGLSITDSKCGFGKNINDLLTVAKPLIESTLNGYDANSKTQYETKINFTVVDKVDDNKDFYIELGRDIKTETRTIGNTQVNKISINAATQISPTSPLLIGVLNLESFAHELRHALGLEHPHGLSYDKLNPYNKLEEFANDYKNAIDAYKKDKNYKSKVLSNFMIQTDKRAKLGTVKERGTIRTDQLKAADENIKEQTK